MKRRLLATLIGLGMLAGCGNPGPVAPTVGQANPPASSLSIQRSHHGRLMAKLKLTDAQKEQIRAIVKKAMQDRKTDDKKALLAMMTAPTVDKEALAEAINAKLAKHEAKVDRKVAVLADIREVLTSEQRQAMAEAMTAKHKKTRSLAERQRRHKARMDRIADKLKMTDEQRAKFDAVLDAYAVGAQARQDRRMAKKAALAEFMTSGDEDALRSALLAAKPEIPVDRIVDAIASLDQDQRQKMVEMRKAHVRKMMERCPTVRERRAATDEERSVLSEEAKDQDKVEREAGDEVEAEQVESGDEMGPDENQGGDDQPGGDEG